MARNGPDAPLESPQPPLTTHQPDSDRPVAGRLDAGLLLAALAQRIWNLQQLGIEQFDEGVYAANYWFQAATGDPYPMLHLYAPPVFPAAQHLSISLFGTGPVGLFFVSLLSGWLLVALAWLCARRWYGPQVGTRVLLLAVCCDFAVVYSRAALTESLHLLLFLAAMGAFVEALRKPRASRRAAGVSWAITSGVLAAAAFATKYTGWLLLPVLAFSLVPVAVVREFRSRLAHHIRCVLVAAATAGLCWLPVWWSLQSHGGYAAVSANHQRYWMGFGGWLSRLRLQLSFQQSYDSWSSVLGLLLLVLLVVPSVRRSTWNLDDRSRRVRSAAGVAVLAAIVVAGPTLVLFSVLTVGGWLVLKKLIGRQPLAMPSLLASAWGGGMVLAVPLYAPYPRLSLLWLPAAWLLLPELLGAAGTSGDQSVEPQDASGSSGSVPVELAHSRAAPGPLLATCLFALALSLVCGQNPFERDVVAGGEDRRGVQQVVQKLKPALSSEEDDHSPILVLAEPAALYYLLADDMPAAPLSSLQQWLARPAGDATRLLVGPGLSPADQERLRQLADASAIRVVDQSPVQLSRWVRLNLRPEAAGKKSELFESRTYRVYMKHRGGEPGTP